MEQVIKESEKYNGPVIEHVDRISHSRFRQV